MLIASKVGTLLLQGESDLTMDGCTRCSCCSCAKELVIPKEVPIVLAMIRVQNKTAKKLPIFLFLILSIFVVIELNIPAYDNYSLYASGIIQFNKTLVISRNLYKLVDESHEWYSCPYFYIWGGPRLQTPQMALVNN